MEEAKFGREEVKFEERESKFEEIVNENRWKFHDNSAQSLTHNINRQY
jgi:hypothetical protein